MSAPKKKLIVFCDGTGSDGIIACDFVVPPATTTRNATNVLRMSRAVKPFKTEGTTQIPQIVYYQSGVGAESDFDFRGLATQQVIQICGRIIASRIRDVYAFIAQNYQAGDEICLFGYSRGAYTVRKVAGIIDRIGLLPIRQLGQFASLWSQLNENKLTGFPQGSRSVKVKCVGVWDTVGSIYFGKSGTFQLIDSLSILDSKFPACIENAYHALAFHENRRLFQVTLWSSLPASSQKLKQVWFGGGHSCVGGGLSPRDLADISLYWMAGEVESFIDLDESILSASHQQSAATWGTIQPVNNFESDTMIRATGAQTRQNQFSSDIPTQLHESMRSSPTQLATPRNMITLANVPSNLRQFVPLNRLDQVLQQKWRQPTTSFVAFEEPSVISSVVGFAVNTVLGAAKLGLEIAGEVTRAGVNIAGSVWSFGRGLIS